MADTPIVYKHKIVIPATHKQKMLLKRMIRDWEASNVTSANGSYKGFTYEDSSSLGNLLNEILVNL